MNKIAVPIIVLSIGLGASPFLADHFFVDKEEQFSQNMTANVISGQIEENGTRVGVNPGSNLDFGDIETGIGITKYLNYNSTGAERLVRLETDGNISDNLNVAENQFVEGSAELSVAFMAEEPGFYSGNLTLKTLTPEGNLGETWLDIKSQFF